MSRGDVITWEGRQSLLSRVILELQAIAHDTQGETSARLSKVVDDLDGFLEHTINPTVQRLQRQEELDDKRRDHNQPRRRLGGAKVLP